VHPPVQPGAEPGGEQHHEEDLRERDHRAVPRERPAGDGAEHDLGQCLDPQQQEEGPRDEDQLGAAGAEDDLLGRVHDDLVLGTAHAPEDAPQLLAADEERRRQRDHRRLSDHPEHREIGQAGLRDARGHGQGAHGEPEDDDDQDRRVARARHDGASDEHHRHHEEERQPELIEEVLVGDLLHQAGIGDHRGLPSVAPRRTWVLPRAAAPEPSYPKRSTRRPPSAHRRWPGKSDGASAAASAVLRRARRRCLER
jgi:hypothetical protein